MADNTEELQRYPATFQTKNRGKLRQILVENQILGETHQTLGESRQILDESRQTLGQNHQTLVENHLA